MMKKVITIDTTRSGYSVQQILDNYTTLTVGELKELLEEYDDDTPIMFKNDNGFTYGHVYDHFFGEEETDVNVGIEVGEEYKLEGWATDVIADCDKDKDNVYISTHVIILDEPDESGWVLANFDELFGEEDVSVFVSVNDLIEI